MRGLIEGKTVPILIVLLAILAMASLYTVSETEQALITQFGRPVGGVITTPGLHVKMPFVQVVHRFDKRWLEYDGDPNEIPTKDKKYIWVDTYARWRIADPLRFFQAVGDEVGGQSRLDDIVDGQTRNAIASFDLIEAVRTTNRTFEIIEDLKAMGITLLLVEQSVERGLAAADWAFVLDLGQKRFEGPSDQILADPRIRELYMGKAPTLE